MKIIQSGEFVGGNLGDTLGEYDRCDRSKLWILFTNIETVNRLPATGYRELPLISPSPPPPTPPPPPPANYKPPPVSNRIINR